MDWIGFLVALAISGLIVGGLARLVLPGPDPIGILGTILAGVVGSFVGGIIGRLVFGPTGLWGSLALAVAGAALLILPTRRARGRTYGPRYRA